MLKCFLKMGNKKLKKLKIKTVSNMYDTHMLAHTQTHPHRQGQREATKMFIAYSKNTQNETKLESAKTEENRNGKYSKQILFKEC